MNLCSGCLQKADLKVSQPQLLSVIKWCDCCKEKKMSYNVTEVIKQTLG